MKSIVMTDRKKLFGNLIAFVIPVMLTGILQLLYSASDLAVCGLFGSPNSTAAISCTASLTSLIVNLFIGLSVGANALMARCYGANDSGRASRVVHTAMLTALVVGVVVGAFGAGMSRIFLVWMGTTADVIDLSSTYLTVYFLGIPFLMIYNFGAALLRAVGDTKRPFVFLSIAGAVNVLLNLLFVIVFRLDVLGVAICTVISQALSAALVVICMLRYKGFLRFRLRELRFHGAEEKEMIRIGLPAGIQSTVISLSNVIIQSSINSFGTAYMGGNGASSQLDQFVYVAVNAVSQGVLSFCAANYGAGQKQNIMRVVRYAFLLDLIVASTLGLGIWLARRPLIRLFVRDEASIAAGIERLTIMMATYVIGGWQEIPAYALRGMRQSVLPMIVSIVGMCGVRIIWIYCIFPFGVMHSYASLMWSYPVSWVVTFVPQLIGFFVRYKKLSFAPAEQGPQPAALVSDALVAEAAATTAPTEENGEAAEAEKTDPIPQVCPFVSEKAEDEPDAADGGTPAEA